MEMDNYVNENDQFKQRDESIPINTAQPNYNSSDSIEVNAGSITDIEQKLNGYCATDLPYVPDAQKDLYALIWKYSEQLKSISAGLSSSNVQGHYRSFYFRLFQGCCFCSVEACIRFGLFIN